MALKQLSSKALDEDGITAELPKAAGKPVLNALWKLFNYIILEGKTPQPWKKGMVVLVFKIMHC